MKNRKKILILAVIIGIISIGSISYAYWLRNYTQGENNILGTGCFNTTFTEGDAISMNNTLPLTNEEGMQINPYTFTLKNTCTTNGTYQINIEVLTSTTLIHNRIRTAVDRNFSKLITEGNEITPTTANVSKAYKIYDGYIKAGETITQDIRVWMDYATTTAEGSGKVIEVKFSIISSPTNKILLKDAILTAAGGTIAIVAKGTPNFETTATTDEGMYAAEDDYGVSYYYRGAVTNNNVIFAGYQWKIIRINGDGSIRIIYNGECPDNNCIINSTGASTQISGTYVFNTNADDSKYVGYMYGGASGEASTSREQATTNETDSNAKVQLDKWYENNIIGKNFENNIVDNIFCNDRQLQSEVGGSSTGPGFGNIRTNYAAYYRLFVRKEPDLKCNLQNDRFTVSDTIIGNGALKYPIGLITAYEATMAGLVDNITNPTNYLNTGQRYWVLTPHYFNIGNGIPTWEIRGNGFLRHTSGSLENGLRPTINLSSNTQILEGNGTPENPYIVS